MRRTSWIVGMIVAANLGAAAPSQAFVFGEPLPSLPPLALPGAEIPIKTEEPAPEDEGNPGTDEPPPGPTDVPVIGGENPPFPEIEDLSGGGIVDSEPPTAPGELQATPEPATIVMGLMGAAAAMVVGLRRRREKK